MERLSPGVRAVAERTLLTLADGEALYTLVGGVKPVSSDVSLTVRVAPTADSKALAALDTLRAAAAALHCGGVTTFVQSYVQPVVQRGDTVVRAFSVVVADEGVLRGAVERQPGFFARLGVTPATDPRDIVVAVESAARAERWRGYGYLFGYPAAAVDFFVEAGVRGDSTGRVEPREFRRIETWRKYPAERGGAPTLSSFVYAVPPGAAESADDQALRAAALAVYARYAPRRAALGRDSLTGIAGVLRTLRQEAGKSRESTAR